MKKKLVIGITGPNGAGKTTFAELCATQFGAKHLSARVLLTEMLRQQGKASNRETQHSLANTLRQTMGVHAMAALQLEKILNEKYPMSIIESFRSMSEVWYVRNQLAHTDFRFVLVAIDAPLVQRIERMRARNSENDKKKPLQLIEAENLELYGPPDKQSMAHCLQLADITVNLPHDPLGLYAARAVGYLIRNLEKVSGASSVSNPYVDFNSSMEKKFPPYVHLMPFTKLEALGERSYDVAIDYRVLTTAELMSRLASMNILPGFMGENDIKAIFDGPPPVPIISFGNHSFADLRRTEQYLGEIRKPDGSVNKIGVGDILPHEALVAYKVPWR